ncbi:hypothetical protein B0J14DRAFT_560832 [Halenospora varia]|nr:hypothetical protein B0J14DRAFT_560832 [Halenospora varia]
MFRISAKSHGDPVKSNGTGVENNSQQISHWRPALRRIKTRLFSSKEETKIAEEPHSAKKSSPITSLFKRGNYQTLNERSPPSTRDGNGTVNPPPVVSPTRPKSKSSENPDKSKRMSLLRRTSSKHSIKAVTDAPASPAMGSNPKRRGFINDSRTPVPPIPQSYVSRRGPQDSPPEPMPTLQRVPSKAAYVPRHAASDFLKINSAPQDRPEISRRRTTIQVQKTHEQIKAAKGQSQVIDTDPTTLSTRESQILNDNVDSQLFLASSRLAAAQRYNQGLAPPSVNITAATPRTSRIIDEITASHYATARERTISAPQCRPSQRRERTVSMAGSVMERMGEYLKPTFPEEGRVRRRTFTEHEEDRSVTHRPDFLNVSAQVDEKRKKGWSTISGTFQVSDMHSDDENTSFGNGAKEMEKQRKRRILIMPTSPGLKKYNKAVRDTYL